MALQHSMTATTTAVESTFSGKNHLNVFSRIFFSLFIIFQLINNTLSNSLVSSGSCFAVRLANGNCINLTANNISKLECCKTGGYYLNRRMTREEHLHNNLLFEYGTPNCVEACNEELPSTCRGYICPEGHYCRVIKNEPKCICRSKCSVADYLSGPLCTASYRRFRNKCHLKRARCASPEESLQVVPCPEEGLRCSESSILTENKRDFSSIFRSFYPEKLSHLSSSSSSAALNDEIYADDDDDDEGVFGMNHKKSKNLQNYIPSIHDAYDPASLDDKSVLSNCVDDIPPKELVCNRDEYCLLRQFDGRPACEHWSQKSWLTVQDCPESTFQEPMCSTDNETFYNSCELKLAGLKNQLEVRIAYKGECQSKVTCSDIKCPREGMKCSPHHITGQPICMDCEDLPVDCNTEFRNGQVFIPSSSSSSSSSSSTSSSSSSSVGASEFGYPVWERSVKTYGWPTVCASNGKAYANTCFLHVVNCLSDTFIDLKKPGFCSETVPPLIYDRGRNSPKSRSFLDLE
ncbi:unnamed protein product [Trichobilharzia szidati]|nr:unnamed protein product [Trichobilharzia szidati]